MRRIVAAFLIAVATAAAGPAAAQSPQLSIGVVREYCAEWSETDFSKVENQFFAGFCLGLVQAFRDGATVGIASTLAYLGKPLRYSGPDRLTGYERWCNPNDIPNQRFAGVFMAWSSENPNYWHLPYAYGFLEAFQQEWPCSPEDRPEQAAPGAETPATKAPAAEK